MSFVNAFREFIFYSQKYNGISFRCGLSLMINSSTPRVKTDICCLTDPTFFKIKIIQIIMGISLMAGIHNTTTIIYVIIIFILIFVYLCLQPWSTIISIQYIYGFYSRTRFHCQTFSYRFHLTHDDQIIAKILLYI